MGLPASVRGFGLPAPIKFGSKMSSSPSDKLLKSVFFYFDIKYYLDRRPMERPDLETYPRIMVNRRRQASSESGDLFSTRHDRQVGLPLVYDRSPISLRHPFFYTKL